MSQDDKQTVKPDLTKSLITSMKWRCIGPSRGGRTVTAAGDPREPAVFYFGAVAGGIWKTSDAGATWHNISDKFFKTASVGAIAVAPSDPSVIYAGMGEATIRLDVSHGDGVYKSTDGGETWVHMGLEDTRHIGKVRVHPHNPDIVYVAALGHAFGPNKSRGVFRSRDGGKTWEHVLFKSENAGAIDLSLDPQNPRILYASIWEARRSFWNFSSGGPESGLYKSTDGGDTWVELTNNPGMPPGIKGKVGVAVSPAQSNRVWAVVEAEKGAFFRSDDGGATWEKLTDSGDLRYRPWYFSHVIADPQDPDTVYVLNLDAWKSVDGGKTFKKIPTPHGDNHDLWIDPHNSRRMIEANDGGACISFNGGESWSTIYNQLTAQFYRLDTDNQFPYRVYATQQDNSSISVPSRTDHGAITWSDCYSAGTGESGYIAVHPENPNIVFVGAVGSSPGGGAALQRYDHYTQQIQLINVWPESVTGHGLTTHKYRFPWTFPILFSPHDPKILYTAGNFVFRTTDEGHSWEIISPDLTRNDPTKLEPSGGPITKDTTGAEYYATLSTLVESPHEAGVFWAGSDDGLLHISQDGGKNWANVTPPELPEWSYISFVEVSPHDPAAAYVTATRYKLDDFQPYLYKTKDYGQTWEKITGGIPDHEFTRVLRADPHRPGLLYAGTETGLYLSFDDGATWQRWETNLPAVPVYDMKIKAHELILATHGRAFWIMDDLTPLHQLSAGEDQPQAYLYAPKPTYRQLPDLTSAWYEGEGKDYHLGIGSPVTYYRKIIETGASEISVYDAGQNPPHGVVITYYLAEKPEAGTEVSLTFLDQQGQVIRELKPKPSETEIEKRKKAGEPEDKGPWFSIEPGTHHFVWNLRYSDARKVPDDKTVGDVDLRGPVAIPGTYQVRLKIGEQSWTQAFELLRDPRVSISQADYEAQLTFLLKLRDKLSATHDAVNLIRDVKEQIKGWEGRLKNQGEAASEAVTQAAKALKEKLEPIEDVLVLSGEVLPGKMFNYPVRLNAKLAGLVSVANSADAAPTKQVVEVFEYLSGQVDEQVSQLQQILETDLAAFNNLVKETAVPAIVPRMKADG